MKYTLFIASFLLLGLPSLAFASFDTDLRYGSQGDKVFELQEFLTEQGVYTGPITGNFYALTLAGVKAFQGVHQVVPVSGFFGPITRGVANGILSQELTVSDQEASTTPIVTNTTTTTNQTSTHMTDSTSTGGSSSPAPSQPTAPAPASQARIDIVSVDQSKGLGDTYEVAPESAHSWSEASSTMQFANLGAVVYVASGDNSRDVTVTVSTDDQSQDTVLHGTGNALRTTGLFYYPFRYLFKTPGAHTITFTAEDGTSESVTLNAE